LYKYLLASVPNTLTCEIILMMIDTIKIYYVAYNISLV